MIKQFLRKKAMIAKGIVNTYASRNVRAYDDTVWWDKTFYNDGVSDRQTISAYKHRLSATYHYNFVESLILQHLYNQKIQKKPQL